MKTIIKRTVISILVSSLFSLALYAGSSLRDKIKKANDSPSLTADMQVEQLITVYIRLAKEEKLASNKEILLSEISKSNLKDKKSYTYEIEALYAKRLLKPEKARYYILKAMDEIPNEKHRFLTLIKTLAFIDTDLENYMRAMEGYLIIQKQLQQTNDINKLVLNYTNIADLYIKSNLFEEAINVLDIAYKLAVQQENKHIPIYFMKIKLLDIFI